MRTDHTDTPAGSEYATVYIAFELSKAKWQLGACPSNRILLDEGQGA